MPNFNDILKQPESIPAGEVYTKCPFSGLECTKSRCVSSITTSPSPDTYVFSGCELINALVQPATNYSSSLATISSSIQEIKSTISSESVSISGNITGVGTALRNELESMQAIISTDATSISGDILTVVSQIVQSTEEMKQELTNQNINQIIQKLDEIKALQTENFGIIETKIQEGNDLDTHIHTAHNHSKPHFASDLTEQLGAKSAMAYQPATLLMQEWSTNSDLDNNGKIYGVDFKISGRDPNKPMILKGIEQSSDWKNPRTSIMYEAYLEEINWSGENG